MSQPFNGTIAHYCEDHGMYRKELIPGSLGETRPEYCPSCVVERVHELALSAGLLPVIIDGAAGAAREGASPE